MSALVGRKVFVRRTPSMILLAAGKRTKSITINNAPIDLTSDDDSGIRQLLETDSAEKSIDMSIEGVTKDAGFMDNIIAGSYTEDLAIEIDGIGTITGRFFIASFAISAPYNEAVTFTAEFQSSGAFEYAASSS